MAGQGSLLQLPGCKFWYADYYSGGKRIRVSTREESKSEARRVLNKLLADRDAGVPETDRSLRYGDLRDGLLDYYRIKGRRSLHIRASGDETITGLAQLDDFFGYVQNGNLGPYVRDITTDTGKQFVKAREADGAGAAVINRSLACLRKMLNLACDEKKLAYVPKIHFLKEPKPRKGIVSQEKFEELLGVLPSHLRPLICFLYWTGVRGGEALAIEWDNVELDEGIIKLYETKNDDPRIIPLPSPALDMLRQMETKTGRVFSRTNLRKEWQKACVAVGLGTHTKREDKPYDPIYQGLNIHDLRRTGLTYLTRSGVHSFTAMEISGHKDHSVFKRYNIVDEAEIKAAMRARETYSLNLGKLKTKRLKSEKYSAKSR